MPHLEKRLERDLTTIRERLAEQAELAQEAIQNAVLSVQTGNKQLAHETVLKDHQINRNMRAIDRLCHSFIAVHLPSAGHLRLLSSAIRVNIELERIGDYAVTVAREGVQMSKTPTGTMARELERLAGETFLMLKQGITAFNTLNAEMAKSTMVIAGQIESSLDGVYEEMMSADQREAVKDSFAMFVVFTQVKRVADQAKNLCEETVFAVTGDQKAPKVYRILFVDEDNSLLSQMAEAAARINFPESGRYLSAGKNPAGALDPRLVTFLDQRGQETSRISPRGVDELTHQQIHDQTVIVALQGSVADYISDLPFHTAALEWDIPEPAEQADNGALEETYREILLQVRDLMEALRGEGAS